MSRHIGTWRRVHLLSSGAVGVVALVHCAVTPLIYHEWSADAVRFLGTGVGLLSIALVNIALVRNGGGAQPVHRTVRRLNWLFLALGVGALAAVPEPQALVIVAALAGQAVAGVFTLGDAAGM